MCVETFKSNRLEKPELNEVGEELVAALRSGEYQQAKFRLRYTEKDGTVLGHCCLGVLCDLAAKKGLGHWVDDNEESVFVSSGGSRDRATLALSIVQWSGALSHMGGNFAGDDALTQHNDNGATFAEIADLIETGQYGFTL